MPPRARYDFLQRIFIKCYPIALRHCGNSFDQMKVNYPAKTNAVVTQFVDFLYSNLNLFIETNFSQIMHRTERTSYCA